MHYAESIEIENENKQIREGKLLCHVAIASPKLPNDCLSKNYSASNFITMFSILISTYASLS